MTTRLQTDFMAWAAEIVQEEITSTALIPSNEINQVFRLTLPNQSLILKTGPNLRREYERLRWLSGRLPCPKPLGVMTSGETDAVLMTVVPGDDLADLKASWPPDVLIHRLAKALLTIHATPIDDWPFDRAEGASLLVHGDACLPNFMFEGDQFSGYIDLGDLAVASPETDLAASVWSLQYNLGPGHGSAFLRAYGWPKSDEIEIERLRMLYEQDGFDEETQDSE